MNKLLTRLLVKLFKILVIFDQFLFYRAMRNPKKAQADLLLAILKSQAKTDYGRNYCLRPGLSRYEFRKRVPIASFDQGTLASWVHMQSSLPNAPVLSRKGAEMFEKTSGSSGTHKLIPYSRELKKSFERYFKVWASNLLSQGPALETYRTFISISPAFRSEQDKARKIGLNDDSEYLSPLLRGIFKLFLSVPLTLKNETDPVRFRDLLCAHLVSDPELEIISIWHPSFLDSAWQHLNSRRLEIAALIDDEHTIALLKSSRPLDPKELWPKLKIISSWDSGASALSARALQAKFQPALFQGKGLLATEAPMTLPLIGIGNVPFLTDILFEFRDEQGELYWMDQIEQGKEYSLVVSQKGGFLRYDMKDLVRVSSIDVSGLPTLEFLGRSGDCSDLVGEKITGGYLSSLEQDLVKELGDTHYCVVPDRESPSYVVLYDGSVDEQGMADWWERRLSDSYHYNYSRKIGQLHPVRSRHIPRLNRRLLDHYASSRGMKLGDIKLKNLVSNPVEAEALLREIR